MKTKKEFLDYCVRNDACCPAMRFIEESPARTVTGLLASLPHTRQNFGWLAWFAAAMVVASTVGVFTNDANFTHYSLHRGGSWLPGRGYNELTDTYRGLRRPKNRQMAFEALRYRVLEIVEGL